MLRNMLTCLALAVFKFPPTTELRTPEALLPTPVWPPPPTNAAYPDAMLPAPPPTVAKPPDAELEYPAPTEACVPDAVFR